MRRKAKKANKFLIRMKKKLLIMFACIVLILVGLIGRLTYIEETSGERYEKIVLSQQSYDSRAIPFQRGDIVDTKGTVLATSVDVYNVILDCKVLNQDKEDIGPTVAALEACFPELESEELKQILKEKKDSQYVVLLKRRPFNEVNAFRDLQEEAAEDSTEESSQKKKDKGRVTQRGVWFEKEYVRNYPYKSLAASLIGFVSSGNVGTTGLENYYNSTLNGINGREYGYLNSDNNFEKTTRNAKDGFTVVSTIDEHVQSIVDQKIAEYNQKNTNGYVEGDGSLHTAVIVMNPQTGAVYAMSNYPTFDLNQPREFSQYFTEEELAGKNEEQKLDLLNKLWENFCITYTFEPGSTVKPMTVACGLETGALTGEEAYVCDGKETFAGDVDVHCVNRAGHGTETVKESLMDSCNDALMQMSYAIGKDNFVDYQGIFGFGQKTGIDLPGEERGLLNSSMKPLDLATNSFGQNFNSTMIQVASAFSSLINGGKYYRPYVVKNILDHNGNVLESAEPVLLKETVSETTSEKIKSYMYATVSEGTGKEAKVDGYSMGGKTGTAQKLPRDKGTYLVSFIGYLPQEDPQLVIYAVIDEPNVKDQAHSNYAQGLVREILKEILPYMNLYPDEERKNPDEGGQEGGAPGGSQEGASQGEPDGVQGDDAAEGREAQQEKTRAARRKAESRKETGRRRRITSRKKGSPEIYLRNNF